MPSLIYPAHAPLFISSISGRFSGIRAFIGRATVLGAITNVAWPSANLALYIPLTLPFAYPAKRVFWGNGSTVNGNVDLGLYDGITGSKIYSVGATLQAGATALQYVTVDWLVQPGEYYLALSLSSGTGQTLRVAPGTADMRLVGCVQEASAHPLPTTMTPAAIGQGYWPLFGLTRTSTGF